MNRGSVRILVMLVTVCVVSCFPFHANAQPADSMGDDNGTLIPTDNPNAAPAEEDPVPTATFWTAIAMTAGLGAMGLWRLRRRIST